MNQPRAFNTVAFAIVMSAIFFAQVKGPLAKLANPYRAQAVQLMTTTHHASVPAVAEQIEFARVQARVQRSQAKLACAQQLLQTKVEALRRAQQAQVEANAQMVKADSSDSEDLKDWE